MIVVRNTCLRLIFLIPFTLFQGNLFSQDTSNNIKESRYWLNAGLGASSSGLSGGLSISYQPDWKFISLRFINSSRYGEGWLGGNTTSENIWDIGALYGLIAKGKYGYASISGGVSLVGGNKHGEFLGIIGWINTYEKIPILTIGIPLEGQLFFTPFSFLGIGINGFANLNPNRSFSGVLISLQVGKLR